MRDIRDSEFFIFRIVKLYSKNPLNPKCTEKKKGLSICYREVFQPKNDYFCNWNYRKEIMENDNEIIIYQSGDGSTRIEVKHSDETVWLSQQQLAELYQSSRTNIVEHIQNIYSEGELDEISTCRKFRQVNLLFRRPSPSA